MSIISSTRKIPKIRRHSKKSDISSSLMTIEDVSMTISSLITKKVNC